LEDLGIEGRIILKLFLKWRRMDLIYLTEDRVQWGFVVNKVMNICFP
jgi:hypothetical protein